MILFQLSTRTVIRKAARLTPLAIALLLSSCDLLGSDDSENTPPSTVLVANGGNFGDQNGSITSYDASTGTAVQHAAMSGFLQGMVENKGKLYALLNTFSVGRVDVLDSGSLQISGQIDDVAAPRSMVFDSGTAYISNFVFGSNGHVSVIDLASKTVSRSIEVGSNPEGMLMRGSDLLVANSGNLGDGQSLSIIDTNTDAVTNQAVACDGPRDLFGAAGGDVIIACTGKTEYNDDFTEIIGQTNGAVLFYNSSLSVLKGRIDLNVQLGSTNGTSVGAFIDSMDRLYVISGSTNTLFQIDTATRTIETERTLKSDAGLIGISGIAFDPSDESLYVGRFPRSSAGSFPDFTTSGTVEVYNGNFEVSASFLAGIAISQILLVDGR